jgi:hypothetical protein
MKTLISEVKEKYETQEKEKIKPRDNDKRSQVN